MARLYYDEYKNKYYNPDDPYKPGVNKNWLDIQRGFHRIATEQLETEQGLTLGLGTEDETSLTAAELKEIKEGGGIVLLSVYDNNTITYNYDFTGLESATTFIVKDYFVGDYSIVKSVNYFEFYDNQEVEPVNAIIVENGVAYGDDDYPEPVSIRPLGKFVMGSDFITSYITADKKLALILIK